MADPIPAPARTPSASSAAQPFTRPVGSKPPGIAHGSNHLSVSSRARVAEIDDDVDLRRRALEPERAARSLLTELSGFQSAEQRVQLKKPQAGRLEAVRTSLSDS